MAAQRRKEHLHAHEIKEEAIFPFVNRWDSSFSVFILSISRLYVCLIVSLLVFDSALCVEQQRLWPRMQRKQIRVATISRYPCRWQNTQMSFFHLINACRIKMMNGLADARTHACTGNELNEHQNAFPIRKMIFNIKHVDLIVDTQYAIACWSHAESISTEWIYPTCSPNSPCSDFMNAKSKCVKRFKWKSMEDRVIAVNSYQCTAWWSRLSTKLAEHVTRTIGIRVIRCGFDLLYADFILFRLRHGLHENHPKPSHFHWKLNYSASSSIANKHKFHWHRFV